MKSDGDPIRQVVQGAKRVNLRSRQIAREHIARMLNQHNGRKKQALQQAWAALSEDANEAHEGETNRRDPAHPQNPLRPPPGSFSEHWIEVARTYVSRLTLLPLAVRPAAGS